VFFVTSVGLTYFGSKHGAPQGVMEKGVMELVVPVKPGDVPQPAPSTTGAPAGTTVAPAGTTVAPAPAAPADVPK
jgi:hypothetical protein